MPEKVKFSDSINHKPVILVAPLDWGLGHATRSIPLINHLLLLGCEVIIASEGKQRALFNEEFDSIQHTNLEGYHLQYGKNSWQTVIKILLQIPKILQAIRSEHLWLRRLLNDTRVDAVISDNRYGLFSDTIRSVFITHQLTIKTPFGKSIEKRLRKINYRLINKFSECWVPDYHGQTNLAGDLSHPVEMPSIPVKYLGRLTRLKNHEGGSRQGPLLIILSGPEPQRTVFERIILEQLKMYDHPAILVRGLPGSNKQFSSDVKNLTVYNYASTRQLAHLISDSDIIVSRPGYSTVMDIIGLNKKCIFVPTPGQAEQQYLATYLQEKHLCISYPQKKFSLEHALNRSMTTKQVHFQEQEELAYKKIIEDLVTEIRNRKA